MIYNIYLKLYLFKCLIIPLVNSNEEVIQFWIVGIKHALDPRKHTNKHKSKLTLVQSTISPTDMTPQIQTNQTPKAVWGMNTNIFPVMPLTFMSLIFFMMNILQKLQLVCSQGIGGWLSRIFILVDLLFYKLFKKSKNIVDNLLGIN